MKLLLDANVLFSAVLRDLFLTLCENEIVSLFWSAEILDETTRNLQRRIGVSAKSTEKLVRAINTYFPDAMVAGYEPLIEKMKNHPGDRHVAAAASAIGADVIVSNNLKHFKNLPQGIRAATPDEILLEIHAVAPTKIVRTLRKRSEELKRPPMAWDEYLAVLGKSVPRFAARLRDDG
ncbi:PIN domain-containing protein [bacterium]|nr:PIN domain-containing protein [bacterium]MCB9479803.1 PIN domain-containing protein [Deltaproteobacteria bacterium]